MTAFIPKQDKDRSLDLVEQVIERFMAVGLTFSQREAIRTHTEWMRRQGDMNVNCKLETVPELRMTRITIELGFVPIPPAKPN